MGIDGALGLLGKVGHIDGTLTRLFLECGPGIGRPTEINVTYEIAESEKTLFVGNRGITGFDCIYPGGGQLGELLIEELGSGRVDHGGSLVAINHDEYRHITIFSLLVETIDIVGHDVAVDDGCTGRELIACTRECLGIDLAHLGNGTFAQALLIHGTDE